MEESIFNNCICTPVPLRGELYIKESRNYFCDHCGKLVKIGITTNFLQRDMKYKATELPSPITTSARFTVKGWDLYDFDKWSKQILNDYGAHCTCDEGGTEFYTVKGAQILLSLLGKIHLVEPLYLNEEYKEYYKVINLDEGWKNYQGRMF